MIDDGLFERPCDAVFALHNMPGVPAGSFRCWRAGQPVVRCSRHHDRGVGGHGAMPHRSKDPIAASAAIITALQTVVARNVAPTTPPWYRSALSTPAPPTT
jgi:hippurate hydrolase